MPKHARSRDGCKPCKQKRIKCDETRPSCRNCQDRNISCPGFTRNLRWRTTFLKAGAHGPERGLIQSFPICEGAFIQTETILPVGVPDIESCLPPAGPSDRAVPQAISLVTQTSPQELGDIDLDYSSDFVLDAVDSAFAPTQAYTEQNRTVEEFAEEALHESDAVAEEGQEEDKDDADGDIEEVSRQNRESYSLDLANTTWHRRNLWTDADTENTLMMHYFNHICKILSCFDSRQNPFRKNIPRIMLTCNYMTDCIIGLSAAHLANSVCGMESIAIAHQTKAMRGLMSVIPSTQHQADLTIVDNRLSQISATYERHQALLAALLLGISAAWYNASTTDLTHHLGARLLFQAWLVDEGIFELSYESAQFDREQCFIIGAMTYLECLASIIIDQPVESWRFLWPFATIAQGQRVYPNPWTGISTPLFIYLAEAATLVRQKRNLMFQDEPYSEIELKLTGNARELYELVLTHRPPSLTSVDDTQDASTPLSHLFAIDAIFRLVVLLELVQVFPEVIIDDQTTGEVRQSSLELAIAVLSMVSDLPQSSGVNVMLCIPLLSAGSALQALGSIPMSMEHGYNLESGSFDVLRVQITALMRRPAMLQMWRHQVTWRLQQVYDRVGLAPVQRTNAILEAVWHRADHASNSDTLAPSSMIHWMDVMIEEGLETLLG